MTHAVLVVAWWFLAVPIQGCGYGDAGNFRYVQMIMNQLPHSCDPLAIGPFPTEQMCVASEKMVEPSNRAFWTDVEKIKFDADNKAAEQSSLAYDDYLKRLAKANPKTGHYRFKDGQEFWREPEGGWSMRGGSDGSCFTASYGIVTRCSSPLKGKNIPEVKLAPILAYDQYHVKQPCEPVKGWYNAVKP